MFKIKKIKTFIFTSLLLSTFSHANDKYLILEEGNAWFPLMSKNLIKNHEKIQKLPFSGFVMVGNTFTNEVMKADTTVAYNNVWDEVKGLKNLYKNKHNFMQVNIDFPADFWDDEAWKRVTKNFESVAKAAKKVGFTGIVFDDEVYSVSASKMSNFKFPTIAEVKKHPKKYTAWEKAGSQYAWVDKKSYRNPKYSFKEHSEKVTERFKHIMETMLAVYPKLTVLVYNGPSLSHENSNKKEILVTDMGLPREHEMLGAIYLGFKEGLNDSAELHDLGESYRYRKDKHFKHAYQWRKYDIAKDEYNDDLNSEYQWTIPKKDRSSWSKDSQVGFMVFNKGQESNYKEYDTRSTSTLNDIKKTLEKALKYSDKYVVYYCQDQDWLLPNQEHPLKKGWMKMMQEVNK